MKVNQRLWEMLDRARSDGPRSPAAKELFTRGGCHAWAMAAALQWNGAVRCSTTLFYWGEKNTQTEAECAHAWCETETQAADFLGAVATAEELVTRFARTFRHHPGFYATRAQVGVSQTLSRAEISQVLSGNMILPGQFYGEREWIEQAVELAQRTLSDFA